MLQGLAINTIAIPKKRWYPNPNKYTWTSQNLEIQKAASVEHPKSFLNAVDWYNLLGVGQANVGSDSYPPWDWALGLSASYSIAGLTHTVSTVARPEKGWQEVYRMNEDGDVVKRWTGLYTAFDKPHHYTETVSADQGQVSAMFDWLQKIGHEPTKSSMGWHGPLALVLPALLTSCVAANHTALGGTFNITIPQRNTSSDPTFSIYLGPLPSMNFSGATCSSTFRQVLFPVDMWIVDMGEPNLSFNNFGNENRWNKTVVYEPTIEADYDIIHSLAIQAHDSIPRMEQMVPSTGLLGQFLLMSRSLQKVESKIQSEAAGLSIVLGIMLQNLLSTSNKYRSTLPPTLPPDAKDKVISYPIQWELYGSSPRQGWEWVAVVVLVVVLLTFCFGFYQTLRYWMGPGSWITLGGMMILAQTSQRLQDIEDKEKAQKRLYLVTEDASGKTILGSKVR